MTIRTLKRFSSLINIHMTVGGRHLRFLMIIYTFVVLGEDYVRSAPAQHDDYYTVIPLNYIMLQL